MNLDGVIAAIKQALADPRDAVRELQLDETFADRRKRTRPPAGQALVRCPWHGEKNPSCALKNQGGDLVAFCRSCRQGGDAIALAAASLGLDVKSAFVETVKRIAEAVRVNIETMEHRPSRRRERAPERAPFAPTPPAPIGAGDRAFGALAALVLARGRLDGGAYCNDVEIEDVCDYLRGRGLLDIARAEGWGALPPAGSVAGRAWCGMLRDAVPSIAADLDVDAAIVAAELRAITRGEGFETPDHRLVIPFRAPDGSLYTWQRRAFDDRPDKYRVPSSEDAPNVAAREGRGRSCRWPYGAERFAAAPKDAPVVYCEGPIDAAVFRHLDAAAGRVRVVLGPAGVGSWPLDGGHALFATGRVAFIATDADEPNKQGKRPGEIAAQTWGADAWRAGALDVVRLLPPAGFKDWGAAYAAARSPQEAAA